MKFGIGVVVTILNADNMVPITAIPEFYPVNFLDVGLASYFMVSMNLWSKS